MEATPASPSGRVGSTTPDGTLPLPGEDAQEAGRRLGVRHPGAAGVFALRKREVFDRHPGSRGGRVGRERQRPRFFSVNADSDTAVMVFLPAGNPAPVRPPAPPLSSARVRSARGRFR